MSNVMADLAVRVGFDGAELTKGLKGAGRDLEAFGGKARAGAASVATYTAAAAAAGAAIAAAFVTKGMQAVDSQAKLAKRLDTTSASIAALKRAGELSGVSMEKITQASGDLTRRLSQAALSGGPVAEALDRIGLSAQQLQAMPLDERIISINDALQKNADASTRAAIAGKLFGEEGALMMTQLDPEVIRQSNRELEELGLKLSKVDAAAVEQANDALSRVSFIVENVSKKLAAELAPALTAVTRMLSESAGEAGNLGQQTAKGASVAVKAFGWVLDAVDGLKRLFEILARVSETAVRTMVKAQLFFADNIVNGPIAAVNALIAVLNKLPGVKIEPAGLTAFGEKIRSMAAENSTALEKAKIGLAEIDAILQRPMPSGKFAQYVEEAKLAAAEAAKVATAVTGGGGGTTEGGGGSKADKEKADAEAQYIADRLERLREANMTELQILADKQMLEIETINAGWEQKFLTDETWNALMLETKQRHEDEISAVEQKAADARNKIAAAEARAKLANIKNSLSAASTLMNTESRKMFEIGKTAAIANSLISTYEGITASLKLGFPVGLVGAAAIGAAGFAQIANIRSQSFGGGGAAAVSTGSNTAAVNAASTPAAAGPAGGTLTVQGLSAGSLLTGDAVAGLAEELLAYQARGGNVVFAG